jgi:hypothetical protein
MGSPLYKAWSLGIQRLPKLPPDKKNWNVFTLNPDVIDKSW